MNDGWLDRLYARLSPVQTGLFIGAITLVAVVGATTANTLAVNIYADLDSEELLEALGMAVVLALIGAGAGTLPYVRDIRRLIGWLGRRDEDGAERFMETALALPRRLMPTCTALVIVMEIPTVLFIADNGAEGLTAAIFLGLPIVTAAGGMVSFLVLEQLFRPLTRLAQARAGGRLVPSRSRVTLRRKLLVGLPIANVFTGYLAVALATQASSDQGRLTVGIVAALVISVTVTLVLTVALTRALSEPVDELVEATERVERGNLDAEVPPLAGDELGRLAAHFNRMLDGLRERDALQADVLEQTERLRVLAADLERNMAELDASRSRIAAAADVGRRRVERQLREGAQRHLVDLRAELDDIEGVVAMDPAAAGGRVEAAREELAVALSQLRDVAHGIFPAILESDGLAGALPQVATRLGIDAQIEFATERRFAPEIEAAVYFCCAEALENVVRHSGVARAGVEVSAHGNELAFAVVDPGQGFAGTPDAWGMGLRNAVDRIGALGGALEISSRPGGGTSVRGVVPLEAPTAPAAPAAAPVEPVVKTVVAAGPQRSRFEQFYVTRPLWQLVLLIGGVATVLEVGSTAVNAILGGILVGASTEQTLEVLALGEAMGLLGLAIALFLRRAPILVLARWWRDAEPESAEAAYKVALELPRLVIPIGAVVIMVLEVPAVWLLATSVDTDISAIALYCLVLETVAGASVLIYLVMELLLAPGARYALELAGGGLRPPRSPVTLRRKLLIAVPVMNTATAVIGVVGACLVDSMGDQLLVGLGAAVFTSLTLSLALTLLLSLSLTRPVEHLVTVAERVAQGDLSARVEPVAGDELGLLTYRFGRMLEGLRERARLQERAAVQAVELSERARELQQREAELRESRARIVAASDIARRRIERDLHDGAQQHLVMLRLKLGLVGNQIDRDPEAAAGLVAEARGDLDMALSELTDLAGGIYPEVLVRDGLGPALETAASRTGLPVAVEAANGLRYPPEVESAVYFCCLEALQNAAKHAGDDARVVLTFAEKDGTLRFEVADDGRGYDPGGANGSSGLQNMADRIGALGGSLVVESAPGAGTRVSGVLPVS